MSKRDFKFVLLIGLMIYGILTLFPFLWMLITSFKPVGDTFKLPPSLMPSLLFSEHPFLNFEMVFKERNFFRYFINSCIVASLAALGQLFTCSLAGFAFARINFRGKNIIYGVLIATMFVPTEVTIIPEFFMMRSFGWLDTLLPLIVPSMLVGAFGTLMMTEYFKSVPRELEEAAFIDGARSLQIFLNVFIPAARPALASLFVVAFIHNWDELLRPVLYITNDNWKTLPQALMNFVSQYEAEWTLLLTGALISTLPLLLVYISAKKHVVQGFVHSGIKG